MDRRHIAHLNDRGVIAVGGDDARKFLGGMITNDIDGLTRDNAVFAGLLSPQGKILFDFVITWNGSSILLDVARDKSAELVKRLAMYKLRASVTIEDMSSETSVYAAWPDLPNDPAAKSNWVQDPRRPQLGWRTASLSNEDITATATPANYHCHRISCGVPEGGKDYPFADTYPHDALFDQLHGVSFTKGCYVGQEIVARMEHRATARRRIVLVTGAQPLPVNNPDIMSGDIAVGHLGSVCGLSGLAAIRLDRAADALANGRQLTTAGISITIEIQSWATFALPGEMAQTP